MTSFEEVFGIKLPSDLATRETILRDNSNSMERNVGYTKRFSTHELDSKRTTLEELSIKLNDLEQEKKEFNAQHKAEVDPLKLEHGQIVTELKNRSQYVKEDCYLYLEEDKMLMHYVNLEGEIVYSRPARMEERQKNIYSIGNAVNGN